MATIIEKFNKRLLVGATIVIVLLAAAVGIWLLSMNDSIIGRNLPVSFASAEYAFDVTDPRTVAGEMDYIFVGEVLRAVSTDYTGFADIPYTTYEVRVLKNIKGELVTDVIKVQKIGGLSKDQKTYILRENDFLPVPGEIYLFNTLTNNDGLPQMSSENSNIKLDVSSSKGTDGQDLDSLLKEIEATKEYRTYREALDNPIKVTTREKVISIYDATR
jgi:hypothetical protein